MEDPTHVLLRLLEELEQLEDEQRALDLRDAEAVRACERKTEALRSRIEQLLHRSDRQ